MSGARHSRGAAPIDPSLGTGLIDNIICEPEDGENHRAEVADDVLDRYGSAAADNATSQGGVATADPADRLADDELDEIELQLRLQHRQPITQATAVGLRGTADLAPDVRQIRAPRRRAAQQPVSRCERMGARPRAVAILSVAALVVWGLVAFEAGGSSHRGPSQSPRRILNVTGSATGAVTAGQLTTAAHLRALVAINAYKTAAAQVAARERRARAKAAQRRAAHGAKARAVARATAATHAPHATTGATSRSTSTSSASEPQPTADGGSATASPSSASSQPATSAAPAGPTGGIGSMTGGCTPQC